MLVFIIFAGAIVGALVGFRFKISVLAPAILFAIAGIIVNGILCDHGPRMIALTALVAAVSLQIGYFVGGILQDGSAHLPAQTTASGAHGE
jgi:hypothetical protein